MAELEWHKYQGETGVAPNSRRTVVVLADDGEKILAEYSGMYTRFDHPLVGNSNIRSGVAAMIVAWRELNSDELAKQAHGGNYHLGED